MLCQHCGKNEATTHIKKNINGQREEMHLCSACATELGVMNEFKMPSMNEFFGDSFIGNFLGAGVAAMNTLAGVDRCATCGASLNDIIKSGKIGCSDCYEKFSDKLEPSIEKMHGKTKHLGKFVTYEEVAEQTKNSNKNDLVKSEINSTSDLDRLNQDLSDAIKEQRFEDAAILRDRINEITGDNNE